MRDVEVKGGHQFIYNFGTGFAVNDELTLSAVFESVFQTKTEVNGDPILVSDAGPIPGSDVEPYTLQTGLTYAFNENQYIEPSVTFGLNEDAVDSTLDIAYVISF